MASVTVIDRGSGDPVLLVPGIQGRWEWMAPCVDGLAAGGRVITCSLAGEPGSGFALRARSSFEVHVDQLDAVFARTGLARATLCGVSYGGWVSLHYAARRPDRVQALVLASTPGPVFRPALREAFYVRAPRLLLPSFLWTSRRRLRPEVVTAIPDGRARRRWLRRQLALMLRHPISPARMARRLKLALAVDFVADTQRVAMPTLVITGEPQLDRVVPVESTRQYLALIAGATAVTLPATGHIGCITRPAAFAALVRDWMARVVPAVSRTRPTATHDPVAAEVPA